MIYQNQYSKYIKNDIQIWYVKNLVSEEIKASVKVLFKKRVD